MEFPAVLGVFLITIVIQTQTICKVQHLLKGGFAQGGLHEGVR